MKTTKHILRNKALKRPNYKKDSDKTSNIVLAFAFVFLVILVSFIIYRSFRSDNKTSSQNEQQTRIKTINMAGEYQVSGSLNILNQEASQTTHSKFMKNNFLILKNIIENLETNLNSPQNIQCTDSVNSITLEYLQPIRPQLDLFSVTYVNLNVFVQTYPIPSDLDALKSLILEFTLQYKTLINIAYNNAEISSFQGLSNLVKVITSHYTTVYFVYQQLFFRRIVDALVKFINRFESAIIELYSEEPSKHISRLIKFLLKLAEAVIPTMMREGNVEAPITETEILKPSNVIKNLNQARRFLFLNFFLIILQIFDVSNSLELIKVKDDNRNGLKKYFERETVRRQKFQEMEVWENDMLKECKDIFFDTKLIHVKDLEHGFNRFRNKYIDCLSTLMSL